MQQDKWLRAALQETGQGFLAGCSAGDYVDGLRHEPTGSRQILGSHPDDDLSGEGRHDGHCAFQKGLAVKPEKCLGAAAETVS